MKASLLGLCAVLALVSTHARADILTDAGLAPMTSAAQPEVGVDTDALDELDPFDPYVEKTLQMMDSIYQLETGRSAHLPSAPMSYFSGCYREACPVYVHVSRSHQLLDLYVNGVFSGQWLVSTGVPGRDTPDFDTHPDGRVYDAYTSTKFPGGDFEGLGNMPYAVFIEGGFALHGTGRSNWPKLGHRASHGCIRQHPDNAYRFNRLVRQVGAIGTWVTVEE